VLRSDKKTDLYSACFVKPVIEFTQFHGNMVVGRLNMGVHFVICGALQLMIIYRKTGQAYSHFDQRMNYTHGLIVVIM
jgi:hypothetical protein